MNKQQELYALGHANELDYEDRIQMVAAKLQEAWCLAKELLCSDQQYCCLSGINDALCALGEPSRFKE